MLKDFTKESFDILIQAGQSNSEGYGFGPVDNPYQPNDRVWYLNGDFTLSRAAEEVTGNEIQSNYSLSFAREYIAAGRLAEGRKLLILRTSVGGTGFLENSWKPEDDLFLRMMEMTRTALALNEDNRLVGLLWHQGETDAELGASYNVHSVHRRGLRPPLEKRPYRDLHAGRCRDPRGLLRLRSRRIRRNGRSAVKPAGASPQSARLGGSDPLLPQGDL